MTSTGHYISATFLIERLIQRHDFVKAVWPSSFKVCLGSGPESFNYSPLIDDIDLHRRRQYRNSLHRLAMVPTPTKEEKIAFRFPGHPDVSAETYYKIFGDLSSGIAPLVILHGDPVVGHEYLLTFADL